MKKLLIGCIAGVAFYGAAFAADMPVKAPAYKAVDPGYNWTGFYVGGTAGKLWSHDQITVAGIVFQRASLSGFLGGLTAGYNFQSGPWVWGVEGDYSWASVKDPIDFGCFPQCTEKLPYFATARGRIGYATNNFLVYVTGGAAFSRIERRQDALAGPPTFEGNANVTGWTIGAGLEGAIGNNWSWKLEYLFANFGHPNVFDPVVANNERHDLTERVFRVGINYRFGGDPWGKGPVVAKY